MKKILPSLFLVLLFTGCSKDETPELKKDYSSFLLQSVPTFSAKLDEGRIAWTFGFNQSQSVMGFQNGYGICDSVDPIRLVFFGLTSESDLTTRFMIYSPRYDSDSENGFSSVFTPGKKKLGNFMEDFHLTMVRNGEDYQTSSNNPANEIEVLKTQEVADYLGKKLRVWFRVEATMSTCGCGDTGSVLADGLMVAEFRGVRMGD